MAFFPRPRLPPGASGNKSIPLSLPSGVYENELDDTNFETYPEQCGWYRRKAEEWVTVLHERKEDFNAFLQTWLLSGLLTFMLQEPIDVRSLIPEGHGFLDKNTFPAESILTRDFLLPTIERLRTLPETDQEIRKRRHCWWKVKRTRDKLDSKSHGAYISHRLKYQYGDKDFQFTFDAYMKATAWFDTRPRGDSLFLSIILVFFESVLWQNNAESNEREIAEQYFSELEKLKPKSNNTASFAYHLRDAQQQHLCQSTILRLYSRLEAPAMWYFMNLDGHLCEGEKHERCSLRHCENLHLEIGHYKRRHFNCNSEIDCEDLQAPQSTLLDILEQDGLPLVKLSHATGNQQIVYVSSTSQAPIPYVAISHVWSDGFGHDSNNALFECQLSAISEMVRGLAEKGISAEAFWMDTLCVPRLSGASFDTQKPNPLSWFRSLFNSNCLSWKSDTRSYTKYESHQRTWFDEKSRTAKKKAISLIRTSFLEAQAVLVMDVWIMSTSLDSLSDAEILIRILNSPWNSRLWTFQEGAMAQKLFFQFANGVYDIDDGIARLAALEDIFVIHTLKPNIDRLYGQLRGFYRDGFSTLLRLRAVVAAVQLRSSTLAADEPLCLAALLDLDLSRLASATKEDRVLEFWRMTKDIPLDIYSVKAPRLQTSGYRWAPQSLLMHYEKAAPPPLNPDIHGLLPRSKPHFAATRYGFHMSLLDGVLQASMIAFDLGDTPGQPLKDITLQIEADLTGHPSMIATETLPNEFMNPRIEVKKHYNTSEVVFLLLANERSADLPFGTVEHSFQGWAREGFLVILKSAVQNIMIQCSDGPHPSESTCQACTLGPTRSMGGPSELTHASDSQSFAATAERAYSHNCGESRPHQNWMETIYLCPARMTLLPEIDLPEGRRWEQFRRDLDTLMHDPNPRDLSVPEFVTIGRWHEEYWKVT